MAEDSTAEALPLQLSFGTPVFRGRQRITENLSEKINIILNIRRFNP